MTTRLLVSRSAVIGRPVDARALVRDVSRGLPLTGKNIAFLLSVSAHVAVGLALARAAHRPSAPVSAAQRALVEIAVVDLVAAPPAQLARAAAPIPAPQDSPAHPPAPSHEPRPLEASALAFPAPIAGDSSPPAVIVVPAPAAPHFEMTVGATTRPAVDVSMTESRAAAPGLGAGGEPVPESFVDTAAKLLSGDPPSYTREAEAAGVEADVPLEIVVDGTGAVIGAHVLTHVGYGLDEAALRGVRAYRFSPARRSGKILTVRMRWLMRFQLR